MSDAKQAVTSDSMFAAQKAFHKFNINSTRHFTTKSLSLGLYSVSSERWPKHVLRGAVAFKTK